MLMVSFGVDFESGGWVFENLAAGESSGHKERGKEATKTIYEVRPGTYPRLFKVKLSLPAGCALGVRWFGAGWLGPS